MGLTDLRHLVWLDFTINVMYFVYPLYIMYFYELSSSLYIEVPFTIKINQSIMHDYLLAFALFFVSSFSN